MRRVLGVLVVALSCGAAQPNLSLKDVIRRVGDYVDSYGDKASIVVCTEKYEQHAGGSSASAQGRTLVSDFALVYADAIHGWLGFRDVLDVDGRAVGDREDRLARVLMGSEGRFDEARRLSDESARFNLGPLQRNFNVPTSALFFFSSKNLDRFKFSARRVLDDGTWEIGFRETYHPTLIQTPDGDPVESSGTIWVRPSDGVVVRTALAVVSGKSRQKPPQHVDGSIDVRYQFVDTIGIWLPRSMDESFQAARKESWDKIDGHAQYSDYRRFETSVRIKR